MPSLRQVAFYALTALSLLMYVVSYVAICYVKPDCINTNDGPITTFQLVYYPLRYLDSTKPAWYSAAMKNDGWLDVQIDQINRGNGYLYFTWNGIEYRSGFDCSSELGVGDVVSLHFKFGLETSDDFTTRFVPTVDEIVPSIQYVRDERSLN